MDWCGNDHLELRQTVREEYIGAFNKAAIFLAKMMRKQEFESLFCKLAKRCPNDMLHSACLTHIGMKIVLSCTCTPQICPSALYRAKSFLLRALKTQSGLTNGNAAIRSQCLSKLGFCCVREGRLYEGFEYLNKAVKIQRERAKISGKIEAKIILAACHNDFAASLMVQSKHLLAIEIRLRHVLPVYEKNLGNHPFTATILNCIGNSYHALGDYDNAIKYVIQLVKIRKQLLGHHQETARSLYDLGVAYSEKNDFERALEYLKEAANLQLEVLDTYDELIHTHQTMSIVLRCLGRNEEAEEEMTRAEESAKKLDSWEAPMEMLRTQELEFDWNHF
ncbi:uncharacterized protein LOC111328795 [Stylophora pistillata]|uniref:Nephrocystin-3 n=1 Tax=Stylophora pistillata TaxID=50429 RepID=A0A2B4SDC1_STYPI|nr:uncharacterized protein LOC111328795 [Stylophora pistillata]PFX26557.1 hypothetical protein AWC38_SpisGene8746 [Stylophora pistillata]